jgi:D-sedoheptulose 7-phosphate isomerase
MARWAITGPRPNPLAQRSDASFSIESPDPQTVQELHLVSVHLLCAHVEANLPATAPLEVALEPVVAGGVERSAR